MVTSKITRRTLCSAVRYLAPASRALTPSANLVLNASCLLFCERQPQMILDFTYDWPAHEGALYEWYRNQPTRKFTSLEYRKEFDGTFRHESIVLRLDNLTICRFDRRAQHNLRADAPKDEGTVSEDTAHVLRVGDPEYHDVENHSEILLSIAFHQGEDISTILSICYGIKKNPCSERYTLTKYNCYFFSWTIVSIAARRAVKWEHVAQSEDEWCKVVENSLQRFSLGSEAPIAPASDIATPTSPEHRHGATKGVSAGIVDDILDNITVEEAAFRAVLQELLVDIRHDAGEKLRQLLLRSQLQPALAELVSDRVKTALLDYQCRTAERSAISIAMSEICRAREHSTKSGQFAGLSWNQHCDVVCAVALDAASAATVASKAEENGDGQVWIERWNETWETQWDSTAPKTGNTDDTKKLSTQICETTGKVWREEWEKNAEVCTKHFDRIVCSTTQTLLNHLPDLDQQHIKLGKRSPTKANSRMRERFVEGVRSQLPGSLNPDPPLQEYIQGRMRKHCETVDRFGFGMYDEVLDEVEKTMCEIWRATFCGMDDSMRP
ncbi:hypothetical protein BDV93DRAFT_610631 [Ceratobasidium sp. AG-I]|nr:hypothetical protein BDV93DRAFT_610631 [Ceratobasidium sp. AG-I]